MIMSPQDDRLTDLAVEIAARKLWKDIVCAQWL